MGHEDAAGDAKQRRSAEFYSIILVFSVNTVLYIQMSLLAYAFVVVVTELRHTQLGSLLCSPNLVSVMHGSCQAIFAMLLATVDLSSCVEKP